MFKIRSVILYNKDKINNNENFFLWKPNILSSPGSPQRLTKTRCSISVNIKRVESI